MYEQVDKSKENKSRAVANSVRQKKDSVKQGFEFVDNRPKAVAQRKLQAMADNYSAQQQRPIQKKENNTGLPDNLKTGIENLSGYSMDDVRVHYNSNKPAQLQAHAYAQGTDIHLGPGQEKHLPHEAWHVVQQKQGRVKPTMQMKGKVSVNDDVGLEKEADVMGAKVLNMSFIDSDSTHNGITSSTTEIVQKVDYPSDSIGTADKHMANRTYAGSDEIEAVSGAKLQQEIIEMAKAAEAQETGGYRLGTFGFNLPHSLSRIPDPHPENHGMRMLPHEFDTAPLDQLIIPLVVGTLAQSGQLKYLEKNWASISRTHDVVIDVDCQFNRTQGSLGFHKDSRGTTVFFNLTYSNEAPMQGPDFYQDHDGAPDLEMRLPVEVQKDIAGRRYQERASGDTEIHSPRLPAFARVSLSDPNLYHSTPKLGHRTRHDRATMIEQLTTKYASQGDFRQYFEGQSDEQLYGWIEQYNFHKTESATLGEQEAEMRTRAATRKRRLSTDLSTGDVTQEELNDQAQLPRTFIRTWVRMVPKDSDFYGDQYSENDMWGAVNNERGHSEQEGLVNDLFS